MKKAILIMAAMIGVFSFAGSVNWGAATFDASFDGGKAYLISVSGYTNVPFTDIANYIEEHGTTSSNDKFAQFGGAGTIVELETDVFGVDNINAGTIDQTANNLLFFVIAFDKDMTQYALAQMEQSPALENDGQPWQPTFEFDSSELLSGKVAGAVPEPTVLALLALGVAGVALRRKKVVA